jgi:V8-like Glu-specific endopeptidase
MDGRFNLYDLDEHYSFSFVQKILKLGESIACMIEARYLVPIKNKYHLSDEIETLAQFIEKGKGIPLGEQENYRHEPAPGNWTGFLIGKDKLLTAAHCVCRNQSNLLLSSSKIQGMMIVFGFQMIDGMICKKKFKKTEVYGIKSVIQHQWSRGTVYADWAIIELDREVGARAPLKLNFSKTVSGNVCMLGHPTGLPLKFAGNAVIKSGNSPHFIATDLSAFQANSGSPIFKLDTLEVIAILTQGNRDYAIDLNYRNTGEKRVRVHYLSNQEVTKCGYEIGQRINAILPLKGLYLPKQFQIKPYLFIAPLLFVVAMTKLFFKQTQNKDREENNGQVEFFYGS